MRDDTSVSYLEEDYPLSLAAALVAAAALASGPIGLALTLLHPQPAWIDAATYAAHAHPIQQLPYALGFFLLAACVMFVARLAALGHGLHRTRTTIALIATSVYAAMIALNYTAQLALVPALARAHDAALAYVTMANPASAAWLLEMFGYAALGIALWVLAPMFGSAGRRRRIRRLLGLNGLVSLAGAVACIPGTGWLLAPIGLAMYFAWNAVFAAAMISIALEYRPRRLGTRGATATRHGSGR